MSNIKKFKIEGMTCNHCAAHVRNSIEDIKGVEKVDVDLNGKNAVVSGEFSEEDVISAVKSAGYKASI